MDECGGGEGTVGAFGGHLGGGDAVQFVVDTAEEVVGGVGLAGADGIEEGCDVHIAAY